jgi:hypothetical protein
MRPSDSLMSVRCPRRKETNIDTIASTKNPFHAFQHELDTFSTGFQQLFAFFDKSLVFFVFASKIRQLLITRRAVTLRRRQETCCKSSPLYSELANVMERRAVTSRRRPRFPNQIQREFLFNDAIASHGAVLASSHPRQKTNLFKPCFCSLSLRSGERVGVWGCHFAPPRATCATLRLQEGLGCGGCAADTVAPPK